MSGICSGFGGNQNMIRIQGMGFSGLITNIVAFFCTYFSSYINTKYLFLIYLLVGDLGIFTFFTLKLKFIRWARGEKDKPNFVESEKLEALINAEEDIEEERIELRNMERKGKEKDHKNERNNKQILTEKQNEEIKIDPLDSMGYFENIIYLWDLYLNVLLSFSSTLGSFPTLIFRFDLEEVLSFQYKFIAITFIFNVADIAGRFLVNWVKFSRPILHLLLLFKILIMYLCYLTSISVAGDFLFSPVSKFLLIFLTALINGYCPSLAFVTGLMTFPNSEKQRVKVGHLYQWCIQVGLLTGASFAAAMF